jgi:hypothetical protein
LKPPIINPWEDAVLQAEKLRPCIDSEINLLVGAPWDFQELKTIILDSGLEERVVTPLQPSIIFDKLSQNGVRTSKIEVLYGTIYNDLWHRAWYAFPLITAVAQAERLGLRELTVVEMGVWLGEGLLNLASLCEMITHCTGMEIKVIGFDTGTGLPSVADYRDHPELWYTGELASPDMELLKEKLPKNCELIIGDISETIDKLTTSLSPTSPLAFMALDVDTYSSSVDALRVFREVDASCLLPATPIYVDDSYINIMQNEFCGEGLAIGEFNAEMSRRKILQKIVRTNRPQMPWHHAMYFCQVFDHPVRESHKGVNFIGLNVHSL